MTDSLQIGRPAEQRLRGERREGERKRGEGDQWVGPTRGGVARRLSLTGGCHGERAGPEQRDIQWEMTLLVSPW